MRELFWTARVLGVRRMLRLFRGYRLGWHHVLSGYYKTRVIQTLSNVGFFDELRKNGVVSVESFAASHNVDGRILGLLCDALVSLRFLKKDGAAYSLDSKGHLLVDVAEGWFVATYGYEELFHSLEALLRGQREYGKDLHRRTEFVTRGYGEVEKLFYFPLMMDIIARNGYTKVLDLGCGNATFLRTLCGGNREVTGYGVDISPDAIADGMQRVKAAALEGRIHLFVEDITKLGTLPEQWRGIDVAATFFVLHELLYDGAERVIEMLRNFRAMFPGVPLIVFEVVRPTPAAMRRRPGMGVHYFLYHDLTRQKPVNRDEWQRLFRAAGFGSVAERHLGFVRTAIYTLR